MKSNSRSGRHALNLFLLIALGLQSRATEGWLSSSSFPSFSTTARKSSQSNELVSNDPVTLTAEVIQNDASILKAAAALTKAKCPMIGVKSLGVDYGLVKTGLAVTVGYQAKPLTIIRTDELTNDNQDDSDDKEEEDDKEAVHSLDTLSTVGLYDGDYQEAATTTTFATQNTTWLCREIVRHAALEQVHQIVVGLPLHKNGTVAEQTNLTIAFCKDLAWHVLRTLGPNVPIVLWDERYTSKAAAALAPTGSYGTLDDSAACIILDCYYTNHAQQDPSNSGGDRSSSSSTATTIDLESSGMHTMQVTVESLDERAECLAYFESQQQKGSEKLQEAMAERERKIQERQAAIARMEEERRQQQADGTSKNKKKKKKRKKK